MVHAGIFTELPSQPEGALREDDSSGEDVINDMEALFPTRSIITDGIVRFLDEKSVPNLTQRFIVERMASDVGGFEEAYKATIQETGEEVLIVNLQVHLFFRFDDEYLEARYSRFPILSVESFCLSLSSLSPNRSGFGSN